ncbi:MAG: alanine dehydrogenase [Desulfobacterales bacterium]|nr:alanine dehydrogenase [Desulfobacterales bacterium]
MIVGILKEIKADENRVALTPGGVEVMCQHGHTVLVETNAGMPSGFDNATYKAAGAEIVDKPAEIFNRSEMLIRVKEPQTAEYQLMKRGQIYFSYLHLAASESVTRAMIDRGAVCIAYETIQSPDGTLPLLKPMSEVAGPMAIQVGAKYLEMAQGGHGVLLGGVPGVDPGTVMIIGGGSVGLNAAKLASGLGAKVYILDINLDRLRYLSDVMPSQCITLMSSPASIRDVLPQADVVVGAVLVPGSKTPTMITKEMLPMMKKGSVLVDVSIDQGGCFETSRETTHADPTYTLDGIVHYAVSNMPGALPRTSTLALNNSTLPFAVEIANKGWKTAMRDNPAIRAGANVVDGKVTYKGVADAFGIEHVPIDELL